jgi:hypothetical protein
LHINSFVAGEIQLNADISSYSTVGYDIEITVADAKNTADPKILTVIIKGQFYHYEYVLLPRDCTYTKTNFINILVYIYNKLCIVVSFVYA